jgi:hypothetical protein
MADVYDIYSVSDSAVAQLGRTLVKAIETARPAYDLINRKSGAKVLMTTSKGSGDMPVLLIVPPSFDAGKPAKLHVHFHGDSATISDVVGDGGLAGSIKDLQAQDPQRVMVLPECSNPSFATPGGKGPSYSPVWSNVSDLTLLQDDAQRSVSAASIAGAGYVVSGHSGGGHGISVPMASDLKSAGGRTFRCNQLRLLDCLHYNQTDTSIEDTLVKWAKAHPGEIGSVVAVLGTMARGTDAWSRVKSAFTAGGAATSYREIEVGHSRSPDYVPEPSPVPMDPDPKGALQSRWRLDGWRIHTRARSQYLGLD